MANEYVQTKKAYKQSKNFYDDALSKSKWWAKMYIDFFWEVDDIEIANELLRWIPDRFDGKILDVPVGTGLFTAEKYRKLESAEITALEYSEDMLEQAKIRFSDRGISNVEFVQGDVGNLPFKDESFDVLLSMNGIHAFPEKKNAFDEMARVLKPGGEFIGCTYIKGENYRSDFVVDSVLSKKGWFHKPFYSKKQLYNILKLYYAQTHVINKHAIAIFRCVK